MLSRGIQRGSSLLWGQLGAPAAQARCVGNASKLFPDGSSVQGDAYPSERGEFGQVSGMPVEVAGRTAYIYAPARTASQQGQSKTATLKSKGPAWKIDFEVQQKWQNPLIGWTSTGDPMEHVARSALNFRSKEEAVAFAEKQGFVPVVREPQRRRPDRLKRYAGYGDNFSVKRHGYPIGGMRSESPVKKQAATEEMHMEPDGETAGTKEGAEDAPDAPGTKEGGDDAADKPKKKRASKKKTES